MKNILHLSDLHFGSERPGLVDALISGINELRPDLVIISGDLTQRARCSQFHAARDFIKCLTNLQVICVPGNHDIALYNLVERFLYPFNKYKQFISPTLCSTYYEGNIAVCGVNTVTPYKPMGGYVTQMQLDMVSNFFKDIPNDIIKIIVMHHNLIDSVRHGIINDSEKIINTYAAVNVNLVFAGHIHIPLIEQIKHSNSFRNMYVITAGTPISSRTIESNSFNFIEIDKDQFTLSIYEFKEGKFISSSRKEFPL